MENDKQNQHVFPGTPNSSEPSIPEKKYYTPIDAYVQAVYMDHRFLEKTYFDHLTQEVLKYQDSIRRPGYGIFAKTQIELTMSYDVYLIVHRLLRYLQISNSDMRRKLFSNLRIVLEAQHILSELNPIIKDDHRDSQSRSYLNIQNFEFLKRTLKTHIQQYQKLKSEEFLIDLGIHIPIVHLSKIRNSVSNVKLPDKYSNLGNFAIMCKAEFMWIQELTETQIKCIKN